MPEKKTSEPYARSLTLENGLFDIQLLLGKAEFVQQDVEEEYFRYDDPTGHEHDLLWEYHRGQIKANIVTDYLIKIRQKLAELGTYIGQTELSSAKAVSKAGASVGS